MLTEDVGSGLVLHCMVLMVMEKWPNLSGGGNYNGK
ncbi:hypothetical protein SLEP1_g60018, partial [Rubroshorea leprosula]